MPWHPSSVRHISSVHGGEQRRRRAAAAVNSGGVAAPAKLEQNHGNL